MGLSRNLIGLYLEHPIMNAAGTCKRLEGPEGLEGLSRSATAACVMGSVTMEARAGNSGNNYYYDRGLYSLNSLGMPNPGLVYYREKLASMKQRAGRKPLIINVVGFSPQDYALLAFMAVQGGADLVELNLGCPNVWDDGKQKAIASFAPSLIKEILEHVDGTVGSDAPIAVKLSPFSDPSALERSVRVLSSYKLVKAVTAVNTFPNATSLDETGKPRITPAEGLAGMAGPALKPIGLGQVRQLRKLLPADVAIIGVGGISFGQDVLDYLRAGATAVQVATAYLNEGPRVFSRILEEYVSLVATD